MEDCPLEALLFYLSAKTKSAALMLFLCREGKCCCLEVRYSVRKAHACRAAGWLQLDTGWLEERLFPVLWHGH